MKKKIIIVPMDKDEVDERNKWLSDVGEEDNYWDFPMEELDYLMENLEDSEDDEIIYGLFNGRLYELPLTYDI